MSKKKNRHVDDSPQIPESQVKPTSDRAVEGKRTAGAPMQSTLETFAEAGAGVAAKE